MPSTICHYDTERSISKLPGSNPVGPSCVADLILCIACIRHSPPANRKWPQAAEEATATEDRPAAATNVNGSGRQTNSSFSKFPSFLPIRSPMGCLPRISVGVGTKSGSWAAAERGGQSRHWRARSSGGRVTTEMYFCNFVATQGCIKEINKVS